MGGKEQAILRIEQIAQELVNEEGLDFNLFRIAHSPLRGCDVTLETGLKTRIVEFGSSEGYKAKQYVCSKHNTSSQWVHEDY